MFLWHNNSQSLNLQQHHCQNHKLYDPEQYCYKNYSTYHLLLFRKYKKLTYAHGILGVFLFS